MTTAEKLQRARYEISEAIADGLNKLGYGVDVPNEKGEMKFGPECHEVQTIFDQVMQTEALESFNKLLGEG
jgi:hypothetical protein